MAQYITYPFTWVAVYRQNGEYLHNADPIRVGGSTGYNSLIGINKTQIVNRMNSSSITPRVYLNIYSYFQADSEYNLGFHKETADKGTSGLPFYAYGGHTWTLPLGWSRLDITNITMTGSGESTFLQAMNNGYTGIVLFAGTSGRYGEAYGVTNNQYRGYIEVVGQWNTPPGLPTILAPVASQKVQDNFELRASPAIDAEQSANQLRYEWSIEDGLFRYYFGWGAPGKTNLVLDFNQFNETTNARASVRAYDGELVGQWAYSDRFTITKNKAPLAPTLKSPIGGVQVDRTQTIVFTWTHNDAGEQSKFDFRWRLQGNTSWNTITETTTNQLIAIPGNTFPAGTIEWNVRTYDDKGLVGPYSNNAVFVASAPSGAPIIVSPINAEVITSSRVTVEWTAPDQEEYELQLVENNVVLWSETVLGTTITREIEYDLENDKTYYIYLRIRETGGIWSPYANVLITTSFTPPINPILTFSTNSNDGSITLYITNPPGLGDEPEVVRNDVFRRVYGDLTPREQQSGEDFIRIATGIEKNGTFVDYTPASNREYEYIVRAYGENGTLSDSNVVVTSVEFRHAFICVASDPANFVRLIYNPDRKIDYQRELKMLQFYGREFPVAEYGPFAHRKYTMSFDFRDSVTLDRLLDMIYARETLLYRDSRGRRDFVAIESISVKEKQPRGFTASFAPERVHYNEEV